jgi:hypothetical protein
MKFNGYLDSQSIFGWAETVPTKKCCLSVQLGVQNVCVFICRYIIMSMMNKLLKNATNWTTYIYGWATSALVLLGKTKKRKIFHSAMILLHKIRTCSQRLRLPIPGPIVVHLPPSNLMLQPVHPRLQSSLQIVMNTEPSSWLSHVGYPGNQNHLLSLLTHRPEQVMTCSGFR